MGLEGMQRGSVQHSGSSPVPRASTVRQQGLMCSGCAQDMTFAAGDECAVVRWVAGSMAITGVPMLHSTDACHFGMLTALEALCAGAQQQAPGRCN